jgi:hypothetical protein
MLGEVGLEQRPHLLPSARAAGDPEDQPYHDSGSLRVTDGATPLCRTRSLRAAAASTAALDDVNREGSSEGACESAVASGGGEGTADHDDAAGVSVSCRRFPPPGLATTFSNPASDSTRVIRLTDGSLTPNRAATARCVSAPSESGRCPESDEQGGAARRRRKSGLRAEMTCGVSLSSVNPPR